MQYIASKGLVHRDLAARNILLFNNFVAKISDFGLCCSLDDTLVERSSLAKKLPIKWLALEVLIARNFSEKSDVWSYGILIYEMFSFGKIPYATMNYDELIVFLTSGARLEQPPYMDEVYYEVMLSCWNKDSNERPSFVELELKLREFIEETLI